MVSRTEKERSRDHLLLLVAVLSFSFSSFFLSFSSFSFSRFSSFSFSFSRFSSFFRSFFESDVSSTCSDDPDSVTEDGEASSAMALMLPDLVFLSFLSFFHEKSADIPFFSFLGEVAERGEVSGEEASAEGKVREGGAGASLVGLGVWLAVAVSLPGVWLAVAASLPSDEEGRAVELDDAAFEPAAP